MATTVRELFVRLGVKADDKQLRTFDRGLAAVRSTALLAVGALAAISTAAVGAVLGTAAAGDEAAKAAKRIGVAVGEMQELTFAAEQSGAQMQDVETAMRRQAVSARDAAKGVATARDAYARIGVSVTDASGNFKGQLALLEEVADGMRGLKTDTDRMAVANDIYGRGGAKLLPLLNEGAEGIHKLRQQARDLGFVMSEEDTAAAEAFTDRLNELRKIAAGLRNQIGLALMPTLTSMIERFRDWFIANREVIDQRIDRVVDGIRWTVEKLGDAWDEVDRRVKEGPGSWSVIFHQVGKALTTAGIISALRVIVPMLQAARLALFGLALNPATIGFVLLAAAVLGVVLIGEDFIVFLQGGNSAIGQLLESIGQANPFLRDFGAFAAEAGMWLDLLASAATAVGEALGISLPDVFNWDNALAGLTGSLGLFVIGARQALILWTGVLRTVRLALSGNFEAAAASATALIAERAGTFSRIFAGLDQRFAGDRGYETAFGPASRGLAGVADRFAAAGPVGPPLPPNVVVNQEGDTITIPTTSTPEQVEQILERRDRQRRAAAADAFRGGDR